MTKKDGRIFSKLFSLSGFAFKPSKPDRLKSLSYLIPNSS
jgi:hypothetical protein